jgi:hypothetical protein
MATREQNLTTALDNLAAILAEITADPKPSYEIDGQKVMWTEYQRMILEQMETLRELEQTAAGPFEVRTYGNTR